MRDPKAEALILTEPGGVILLSPTPSASACDVREQPKQVAALLSVECFNDGLVDGEHDDRIRNDAQQVGREAIVESDHPFLSENKLRSLDEPGIFPGRTLGRALAQTGPNDLMRVGDDGRERLGRARRQDGRQPMRR